VDGSRELRFGGKSFRRAIGVHAYSRLTWPLDGKYAAFRTQYAVDERLSHADMTVRVKLGDKVAYEKQNVRAGTLSPVISVDLGGAKSLTLEVDYGSGTDVQDRLVWLEPALLKKK
jgi:NPCBM/NEW2 domain-containing protein